jgi:GNAT superfamily N-acetyltransferase
MTIRADGITFTGYFPGVVGKVTELHAEYYAEHWGFDRSFETQVGREFAEFIEGFSESRDELMAAVREKTLVGSIAVDGSLAATEGARIRWFIVAPPEQGKGLGKTLLSHSVQFCRRCGYKNVFLWTFEGLKKARTLYEQLGFRLCIEHEVDQWGTLIREQKFELRLF